MAGYRKLSRNAAQRKALIRNQVTALINNGKIVTTEAKAKEIAKNLYKEKGYKGNLICTYTKQVTEGEPVAFEVAYTPSKSSNVGTYLVFGIEA